MVAEKNQNRSISKSKELPILETVDLVVKFGGITALNGVNLRVFSGKLTALIGPNGAGKTTLFNAITGAAQTSSGRVLLEDKDITGLSPHKVCKLGISRTFQITNIFSEISVKENVWLGVNSKVKVPWNPVTRAERLDVISQKADGLCKLVGLGDKMHATASRLPHGDQKLLEIAIALSVEPDILLLDEPTQGVSPQEIENINTVVRNIAESRTVLMIDHNMATVLNIADIIAVLHNGTIITEAIPSDIIEDKRVQEIYLGTRGD